MKIKRRQRPPCFGWLQTHRAGMGTVAIVLTYSGREVASALFAAYFGTRHDCRTYRLPDRDDGLELDRVFIAGGLFIHWTEEPFIAWDRYRTLQKHQAGVFVYPKTVVQ